MRVDVVAFDGADELDAIGPLEVMRSARRRGADVDARLVALDDRTEVCFAHGLAVRVDQRYVPGEAEVLIVPGGGWADRRDDGVAGELARGRFDDVLADAHHRGVIVAAVCTGAILLAQSGLLTGRRAATHHGARDELARRGALVETDRVVDDGDVITCGGVTSGLDLALWILEREVSVEIADAVAAGLEYTRTRPTSSPGATSVDRDHWVRWHDHYEDPGSALSRRLVLVQLRLAEALTSRPPGPIRLVSLCSGEARDVLGVLETHPRASDVVARLVELDPRLCEVARERAARAKLTGVDVVCGDASVTSAYEGAVPADVVLACGVFGNVEDSDIERTARTLPSLCAPGARVIWTRHRRAPDVTGRVRQWFADAGFAEVAFDLVEGSSSAVGTCELVDPPAPYVAGVRMFSFTKVVDNVTGA